MVANNELIGNENNIVFYEDENNNTKVEVRLKNEDVWLNVNAIANLFLDYAEDMAEEQKVMTMQNWIDTTDRLLEFRDKKILIHSIYKNIVN